jgi:hypothetical protein
MPRSLPSFIRPPAAAPADAPPVQRDWRPFAVIAGLTVLLLLQVLLADRDRLAAHAGWRPVVAAACKVLQCDVPAWRDPAAFTLVRRDVLPHPARPGVLHVSASFRNDAVWPQAWPVLVLTLSDIDGRRVGSRAFRPDEYMGDATLPPTIASGADATVEMDILEPAPDVVAFTFDFR